MEEFLQQISNQLINPITIRGSVAYSILNEIDFNDKSDLDILISTPFEFIKFVEHLESKFHQVKEKKYIYNNTNLPRRKLEIENNNCLYHIDVLIVENYFLETTFKKKYSDKILLPSSNELISSIIIALSSNEIGIDLLQNDEKTQNFYKRLDLLINGTDIGKTLKSQLNQIKCQNIFYSTEYSIEEILYYFYKNYQIQKKLNPILDNPKIFEFVSNLCSFYLNNSEDEIVEFYKSNDKYGCFSNFSPYKVEYENEEWQTAEHCYQAHKFTNAELRHLIKIQETPKQSAQIGRTRADLLRIDWDFVRIIFMYNIVKNKVLQNPIVYITLLSTKNKPIFEISPKDSFWGLGRIKMVRMC